MKIQFLGAAQTVTGSCYIMEANGSRFAVDCGMHQGNAQIEQRNRDSARYNARALDFILLTHAHIDHSGLLPRLVKDGFQGPVYCTEPTLDLLGIMLLDSAHIQEMEAEWANRKRARRGGEPVPPLYTTQDAVGAASLLKPAFYGQTIEPAEGVRVTYKDAGHILGSSFLELEISENGKSTRLVFSGDLGRPNALLMPDPVQPKAPVDYLFLESTYGDRDHKDEGKSLEELADAIAYSYANGQKTIIPAFAVERTQEILYVLHKLYSAGRLPDIPVYVDSPLAIKATEIFRRHQKEYLDKEARSFLERGEDPLSVPNLKYTLEAGESRAINEQDGPAIVISASGMCNAGRIKHHLRHNLWREGASIVFVGYQAVGTPGRKIVDGAKNITILGDEISIKARIFTIGGFSAHAGQSQLLDWVDEFARPGLEVFLVHGEEKAQKALAELLRQRSLKVECPAYLEEITILPGREPQIFLDEDAVPKKIKWDFLLDKTAAELAHLRAAMAGVERKRWADQVELQDELLNLQKRITKIISQI